MEAAMRLVEGKVQQVTGIALPVDGAHRAA